MRKKGRKEKKLVNLHGSISLSHNIKNKKRKEINDGQEG